MRKLKAALKGAGGQRGKGSVPGTPELSRAGSSQPGLIPLNETALDSGYMPQPSTAFPDGVRVWQKCPGATVDICFVHGLSGNREGTWTASGQSAPWPQLMIPRFIPTARVITYGYDAYVVKKSVASSNRLQHHALNLLKDVVDDRTFDNAIERPIIFVAHSLGGLVVKEALALSRNHPEHHLRDLFNYTKGVIFMGTPHKGAWIADWARLPASVLGIVKSTNTSLLKVLQTDDEMLESIQNRFLELVRSLEASNRPLKVTCFVEELPLLGVGLRVVDMNSGALPGWPAPTIHADHTGMVKFASEEDNGFKRVMAEIMRWEKETRSPAVPETPAPPVVASPNSPASPMDQPTPPMASSAQTPDVSTLPAVSPSNQGSSTWQTTDVHSHPTHELPAATPASQTSISTAPPQLSSSLTGSHPTSPFYDSNSSQSAVTLPNTPFSAPSSSVTTPEPAPGFATTKPEAIAESTQPSQVSNRDTVSTINNNYAGPVTNYSGPVTNYSGTVTNNTGPVTNNSFTVSGQGSVNYYYGDNDLSKKLADLQVSLTAIAEASLPGAEEKPTPEELAMMQYLSSVACSFCENCKSGILFYSNAFACISCKLWLCNSCNQKHPRAHRRLRYATHQWMDSSRILNKEADCKSCGAIAKAKLKCATKDCDFNLCISCAIYVPGKGNDWTTMHVKLNTSHVAFDLVYPLNWFTKKAWRETPCSCLSQMGLAMWHHCERCHQALGTGEVEELNSVFFCSTCWKDFGLVQFICKTCFLDNDVGHAQHREQHYFSRMRLFYDPTIPDDVGTRYWDPVCNQWLGQNEHYTHQHAGMIAGTMDPQRLDYMVSISSKTRDTMRIYNYRFCDRLLMAKNSTQHFPAARDPDYKELKCVQCQFCE